MAMISLIEDYSLVGFETLAVEVSLILHPPNRLLTAHTGQTFYVTSHACH